MKVEKFYSPHDQMCTIGNHSWDVARLFELSRKFPVVKVPIDYIYVYYTYEKLSLREMVMHFKAVNDADLSKPIILDEDGCLMDGRHRIMKAILNGKKTIKAVRFDKNPSPCRTSD
jgi:hypothetical protein